MSLFIDFRFVKDNASFEAILRRYGVVLKGSGDERSALCPFHDEKKASFKVNLAKGGFHCFGCGAKGNVLDLVVKKEGCGLRQAAVIVAEASGVSLSERADSAEKPRSVRNDDKARQRPEAAPLAPQAASETEKEAPVAREEAEKPAQPRPEHDPPLSFRLKLNPDHPYLRGRLSASLIQHFELGHCDRGVMKGRIAIPIHDADGELVAYAGRWADGDVPEDVEKYLLPPKFRKTLVLFNLSRLVRPVEHGVVVEGYFGAMRLHGLGVPTVALMGSSIADEQVSLLRGSRSCLTAMGRDELRRSPCSLPLPVRSSSGSARYPRMNSRTRSTKRCSLSMLSR